MTLREKVDYVLAEMSKLLREHGVHAWRVNTRNMEDGTLCLLFQLTMFCVEDNAAIRGYCFFEAKDFATKDREALQYSANQRILQAVYDIRREANETNLTIADAVKPKVTWDDMIESMEQAIEKEST